MSAKEILSKFFDENSFNEIDALLKSKDENCEAVAGAGLVDGELVYAFAQDIDSCGGAMSKAQAKKITKIYDLALKTGAPIVGFYDSVGGRLDEEDLMASYGDILQKASTLSGVVPQISVVLGTCLGTSALIANSADFLIMNKDATLSVCTLEEKSNSEEQSKHGNAQFVCENTDESIETAKKLLSYFPENNLEQAPVFEAGEANEMSECLGCAICDKESTLGFNKGLSDKVGTAFGRLNGMTVGIVRQKGEMIDFHAARKIIKMVKFCDAFSIPVITIVNAKGFECLSSATKVVSSYAEATTAKISIIQGEAIGSVYVAFCSSANNDVVYALDPAVVSPVSSMAAALILDEEAKKAPIAELKDKADSFVKANLSANNAASLGFVDDIVVANDLREKVAKSLDMLVSKRVSTLPKKHSTI